MISVTAMADDDDIVNAKGFEPNPPHGCTTTHLGTGTIEGQFNPPGEGQLLSPGQWQQMAGNGTSTAVVQSAVFAPGGGNQAVRVDRTPNSDVRWAVPVDHLGYPQYPIALPPETPQPCLCITWDMLVDQTVGPVDTFGPFFGVEAYDDEGNSIATIGSFGVDATTGDVLYQDVDTGILTETGSLVDFGEWNRFQIKLDYSTHEYTVRLNNLPLATIGFVDQNNIPGGLNDFSDADIATLAAAGDPASLALTGTAYFDNFLVREGECVPEPSALAVIAAVIGLISCGRRCRQ
jgi:hypothetical protein